MLWLWTEVKLSVKGEGSVEKRAVRHGARREGWFMGHNLARTMGHNGNNIILRDDDIHMYVYPSRPYLELEKDAEFWDLTT